MAEDHSKDYSADSSDREGVWYPPRIPAATNESRVLRANFGQETFEDAPDTASRPQSQESSSSVRSLTNGRPSSTVSTPRAHKGDPIPIGSELHDADLHKEEVPAKSPLLTAHRISATSLDDVQLDGATETASIRSGSAPSICTEKDTATSPPKLPFRGQGLSGNLPSIPWGPPPPLAPKATPTVPTPSPTPAPRKLGMSFSWLSRSGSATKEIVPAPSPSPTSHDRRNTVTSMASMSSNPELMLSKLDEGHESDSSAGAKRQRNSLRERFKMLRLREEAGIQSLEGQEVGSPTSGGGALAGLIGRSASLGLGIGSPTSIADEKEGGLAGTPVQSPVAAAASSISSVTNPNLAPGTASGVSAGPSAMTDPAAPVDWDLWQSVVYEGPSAVARTSAEELSVAIASGIPSAIRGVVWQVLAQSKNEELESVYKELVVRGTDKDRDTIAVPNGHQAPSGIVNSNGKKKDSVASSSSSIHSGHSTPATSATNGLTSPSPSQEKDSESIMKLQAAMMAERKKKAKEDAAALQKLEKVIRKDLGARTSYSKFAVAAGLQEGLFGVCKAYALFDEGVGYAQGMNFLVMPLLFNVSQLNELPRESSDVKLDAGRRSFLSACATHEPIPPSRNVYTRYAWSTSTSIPV